MSRQQQYSALTVSRRLQVECLEDRELLAADLLQDINREPFPRSLYGDVATYQGDIAYFARDAADYPSLWLSDGEHERNAPKISGLRGWSLTATEDDLFFLDVDEPDRLNIWQTDGSREGTILLGSAYDDGWPWDRDFFVSEESLFFVSTALRNSAEELWGMRGWDRELELLIPRQPDERIGEWELVGSSLFFAFHQLGLGDELWTSDGTAAGTRIVKDIRGGRASSFPQQLVAFEDRLFMTALDQQHGFELWTTDGTEDGTFMVRDINPGQAYSRPGNLAPALGELYFRADDGVRGAELWKSDGTSEGTVLVADVNPGPDGSNPRSVTQVGDSIYFVADSADFGRSLYVLEPAASSARLVSNLPTAALDAEPEQFTAVGDQLFFVLDHALFGKEVWVSDGTPAGTRVVTDIYVGIDGSNPTELMAVDGKLAFLADDGVHGSQIWKTAGTADTTELLSVSRARLTESSVPQDFNPVGDVLLFTANVGPERGLWRTDGSRAGTTLVSAVGVGRADSMGQSLARGDELFLVADDSVHGKELWISDGTAKGTGVVLDIVPGEGGSAPTALTLLDDKLLFTADDGVHGREPWISDGTAEGTHLLKDIAEGASLDYRSDFATAGDYAFFVADDGVHGRRLWRTDGTTEGTFLVQSTGWPPGSSNGMLYFMTGPYWSQRPFATDRSARNEVPITLFPDSEFVPIRVFSREDGGLFFWLQGPDGASQLWFVDPINSTAQFLIDATGIIHTTSTPSNDHWSVATAGKRIFYFGMRGYNGTAVLWTSDGTPSGTHIVKEFNSRVPLDLAIHQGVLYFSAYDEIHGYEVWRSDGTAGGTYLFEDVVTGPQSTTYRYRTSSLAIVGDTLFFSARTPQTGIEPLAIHLGTNTAWSQSEFFVGESGAPRGVPLTVSRTGRNDIVTSLRVSMHGETATGGVRGDPTVDYVDRVIDITFSPGESSQTVWLEIQQDDIVEADEQLRVEITVVGGGFVGDVSEALVTIIDDDRLPADFNADQELDLVDIDLLVRAIAENSAHLGFDLDRNAIVDSADLAEWLSQAGAEILGDGQTFAPGDANLDGLVDGMDYGIWQANRFSAVPAWSRGDFNADGFVDGADFNIWIANRFHNPPAARLTEPKRIPLAAPILEILFSDFTLELRPRLGAYPKI